MVNKIRGGNGIACLKIIKYVCLGLSPMEDHIFSLFTEFSQPLMKNTLNIGKLKLKRYLAALFDRSQLLL
ncbi:hypothetical protein [Sphingobacterium sp. UBA3549]|uniref:hypothetical protein n=1 Tax=Sphingobacterium sp. UBA3549 TaxID=1947496 RepID=UPI0025FD5FBB|nr:hypothetical protein [Sphingobacterium sp. UBA3549]